MSTAYIFNGFGEYEQSGGKKGITLKYAGIPFFLPFSEVTAIPDWTLRAVDQDKSTPEGENEGSLVYMQFTVSGKRIAEELLLTQIPFRNRDKGIIEIQGKPTGQFLTLDCGVGASGERLTAEVREVEATRGEKAEAETLALEYKKTVIQDYFQSKRERMAGGKGLLHPTGLIRVYMKELNVEDIDDVTRHQKTGGLDADLIIQIIREMQKSNEINGAKLMEAIETVRKTGKAQLAKSKPRSEGIAEYKEAYDNAIAAGKTPEEAKQMASEARELALAG